MAEVHGSTQPHAKYKDALQQSILTRIGAASTESMTRCREFRAIAPPVATAGTSHVLCSRRGITCQQCALGSALAIARVQEGHVHTKAQMIYVFATALTHSKLLQWRTLRRSHAPAGRKQSQRLRARACDVASAGVALRAQSADRGHTRPAGDAIDC